MTDTFIPDLQKFFLVFTPAFIGIILHEVAHGFVAYLQGDPTAKNLGRLTLNPLKHLDPTGTLIFILTAMFSPFVFGWAKPVPVQPQYFKNPRSGMRLVAIAGPLANFFVALVCAFIAVGLIFYFQALPSKMPAPYSYIALSAISGITINCLLAWFNLMPLPPLDGSHLLMSVLPAPVARQYAKIGRYGFIILVGLIYFNLLSKVLWPLIDASEKYIVSFVQLFF